jgi:hypothetical protein
MNITTSTRHHARSTRALNATRLGMLASACLGTLGLAAGAAQAFAGVAVADDAAHALANPGNPVVFRDAFDVHQDGAVIAASARNQAESASIECSAAAPCRSIALSFQIVTMAGENIHLNAANLSNSENVHCGGCETLAGAYQFIVSTPAAFTLSPSTQLQLEHIHSELNALGSSSASIAQVQADADALATQVDAILHAAAASAVRLRPSAQPAGPLVTMHRMFDQG